MAVTSSSVRIRVTLRRKITFVPIIVKKVVCLAFRGRVVKLKISEVFLPRAGPGVGEKHKIIKLASS